MMITSGFVVILLAIGLRNIEAEEHGNDFDAIKGCKQYNTEMGYDDPLYYIPTNTLNNTIDHGEFKYYKIGVLGTNDGVIRLSNYMYPYDKNVTEIVVGSHWNTRSGGRTQYRTSSNENKNTDLVRALTPNMLNPFRPVMLKLKLWVDGKKEVFHDGHDYPFLGFMDTQKLPVNYMAFTRRNLTLVFFYDCPM
uniref:uncharacterized protein LOC120948868 n=1 Tax=Anopheles coluzzii TaxID=1518534 RepID=UPI0020FFEAD7|nr:uncharacterized protein LOC120948868 [Anopheles coluzzii]